MALKIPVELKSGPGGALLYVDKDDGTAHRTTYTAANQPLTAHHSDPDDPVPLAASFDGTGSSDPEGKPLSDSWDLDGDRAFGDAELDPLIHLHQAGVHDPTLGDTDHQWCRSGMLLLLVRLSGAVQTTETEYREQPAKHKVHRLRRTAPASSKRRSRPSAARWRRPWVCPHRLGSIGSLVQLLRFSRRTETREPPRLSEVLGASR